MATSSRTAEHTKSGEGVELERAGTRAGHQYNLLGHIGANSSGVIVEPYLISLTSKSDTFETFQHDGIETIYMLEGEIDYRHGDKVYSLKPGDTLFLMPMLLTGLKINKTSCKVFINYILPTDNLIA